MCSRPQMRISVLRRGYATISPSRRMLDRRQRERLERLEYLDEHGEVAKEPRVRRPGGAPFEFMSSSGQNFTALGKHGEFYEESEDYEAEKPVGTQEMEAHYELSRRIGQLMVHQESTVVPIVKQWIAEGNRVTRCGLIMVRQRLRDRHRFHHALMISNWIAFKERVIPYDRKEAYNHIDLLSRVDVRRAKIMFENLPFDWKSKEAYTVLLSMYTREKMVPDAEAVYYTLKRWGLSKISQVNMMMSMYQRKEMSWKIPDLVRDAKQAGLALDSCSYNIILPMKFKSGGVGELETFHEVLQCHDLLDERTYFMLARCYAEAGLKAKAEEMLLKVEQGVEAGKFRMRKSMRNVMMSLYGVLRHEEGVQRMWKAMRESVSGATFEDYISVVENFGKLGLFNDAKAIFNELDNSCSKRMPLRVYNAILNVYVESRDVSKAEMMFKRMDQLGYKPDQLTYHHMVCSHLKVGDIQRALHYFKLERQVLLAPFELTKEDYKFRMMMGLDLPNQDKRPWIGTFRLILEALAEKGDVRAAESLFREWRQERWNTDARLFHALLKAYVKAGEPASGFLQRMVADDVEPTQETKRLLALLPTGTFIKQLI